MQLGFVTAILDAFRLKKSWPSPPLKGFSASK